MATQINPTRPDVCEPASTADEFLAQARLRQALRRQQRDEFAKWRAEPVSPSPTLMRFEADFDRQFFQMGE